MSAPTTANFTETQGDTWQEVFALVDGDGADFVFDGWTLSGQIKATPVTDDSTAAATMTFPSVADGQFTARLDAGVTTVVGTYAYDIQIANAAGDVHTIFKGTIVFEQQVTA